MKKILFLLLISNLILCQKISLKNYSFTVPNNMKVRVYDLQKIKSLENDDILNSDREYYDFNSNEDYIICSYFTSKGKLLSSNKDLLYSITKFPELKTKLIESYVKPSGQYTTPELITKKDILIIKTEKTIDKTRFISYTIEDKLDKITLLFQQSNNKKWDDERNLIINSIVRNFDNSLIGKVTSSKDFKNDDGPRLKSTNNSENNQIGKLSLRIENNKVISKNDSILIYQLDDNLLATINLVKNPALKNIKNSDYSDPNLRKAFIKFFEQYLDYELPLENNFKNETIMKPTFTLIKNIFAFKCKIHKQISSGSTNTMNTDYLIIPDKENLYLTMINNFKTSSDKNLEIKKFFETYNLD